MASISISGSPSTTNNSITINYTTSGISNITNVQLSKDGGSNYINPMSFSNTSATFNVGDWSNGTYSNCVLKVTYTDTSGDTGTTTIPCTGITLSSNSLTFTNNNPQTLTATVAPSNTTDTISWSTNSSSVATVSNGVVTPQSNGSTTITARCGSHSASCNITVNISTDSGSGGGGSTGGGTVSNESNWANGVPYTFNWVDGEYVSNTNGEFKVYDSDSRTPKLYCYRASTIEIASDSRNQYNAWYTSDGTFIRSFSIPGTIVVPSNAHYFAVTSNGANKSSVTITPHS